MSKKNKKRDPDQKKPAWTPAVLLIIFILILVGIASVLIYFAVR